MKPKARVIAMYLPQYHPIPENDAVWGKGFTEWTNVGRAKPLFRGHYQPRVPADLGYYDLRMPEVREAQAELAREAGIEGFMYWHYWFGNGKMALERPFKEVVESGHPDFPFCVGWGNHSWKTDQWQEAKVDYKKQTFIFEQTYPGDDDIIAHFNYLLSAFKDKRYIKVEGKPLFAIWAPNDIPDFPHFKEMWNKLAIENGLNGIYIVGLTRNCDIKHKLDIGLDAVILGDQWRAEETVKSYFTKAMLNMISKRFPSYAPLNVYQYKSIIKNIYTDNDKLENVFPTIFPNWDRSPRSGRRAVIYTGSTPNLFQEHVKDALDLIKDKQDEHKIIFLRSWNEWAEGNYMEPDLKFGKGYLDALKNVLVEN